MTPVELPFPLLACALVVLRVSMVGHAPDDGDTLIAGLAAGLWLRFGSSRAVDVVVAALLLGAGCAVPWSRDPWISLLSCSLVAGCGACLAVGSAQPLRHGLWAGLALGGAAHAFVAAHQRFIVWPDALAHQVELELEPSMIERLASLRPLGLSISPDLSAAVGIAGVVGAAALVVDQGLPLAQRRWAGMLGGVSLGALLLSRSFGALLAVAVGVVVVAVLSRSLRALLVLGLCALGALFAVVGRGMGAMSASAAERLENWRIALQAFVDAPLVGQGLMRFAPAYLERRGPDDNVTRYAHSLPLQWLAETGLVGAVAAVVVVVVVATQLFGGAMSLQRRLLVGGTIALWSRGLIDYDFEVGQTAMLASLVLGTALVDAPRRRSRVLVVAAVAILLCGLAQVVRLLSPATVLSVDVDAALSAVVDEGAPAEPTLSPFMHKLAPVALLVVQERLAHDDVVGAQLLLVEALRADPGNATALQLRVALARATEPAAPGALAKARAEAARWHVDAGPDPVIVDEKR